MKLSIPTLIALMTFLGTSASEGQQYLAYAGTWHVVENLETQTCYRVHAMSPRKGGHDFGQFNIYRMAGAWIWRHHDICRASPAFE